MKLEMGESLISSWLKHVVGCKIVQLNWKADKNWKGVDEKIVQEIISAAKESFKEYGQAFSKQDSQPFILQGEIDVLGYDWDNNIFYMTDIAFHENNLSRNYMRKIAKKMIRSALIFKFYFQDCREGENKPKAEIIFATPSVSEKTDAKTIKNLQEQIKTFFIEHNINCTPRIIYNDEFYKEILVKVSKKSEEISDTSELFMRSAQLINCCEKFKE